MKKVFLWLLIAGMVLSSSWITVSAQDETIPELSGNQLSSEFAYVYDPQTDQILFDKNSMEKIYPASLTKVMTIALALENIPENQWNRKITMTREMWDTLVDFGATNAGYWTGTQPTLRDCLYAAYLVSAAEASNALAIAVSGSIPAFVDLMNEKAAQIGMNDTVFHNATGMPDIHHVSSCRDLSLMMEYALSVPGFKEMLACEEYTDSFGTTFHSTISTLQQNGWRFPGLIGEKPGFTTDAGLCTLAYAELNDMSLILVLAQADWEWDSGFTTAYDDLETMLTWFSDHYSRTSLAQTGQPFARGWKERLCFTSPFDLYSEEDLALDLPKNPDITIDTGEEGLMEDALESYRGQGTARFYLNEQLLGQINYAYEVPEETFGPFRALLELRKQIKGE